MTNHRVNRLRDEASKARSCADQAFSVPGGRLPVMFFKKTTGLEHSPEFRRVLTIGKKRIEREDRGVVAREPVAPAHVHCMHDVERDTGHGGFFRSNRAQEIMREDHDFCFHGLSCLLCPVEQVYEKSPIIVTYQSGTREDLNSDETTEPR